MSYRFAPLFVARITGAPFEILERLGTERVSHAAREILRLTAVRDAAADALLPDLAARTGDDRAARSKLFKKLSKRSALSPELVAAWPWLAEVDRVSRELAAVQAELDTLVDSEYRRVHEALVREGSRTLPDMLVVQAESSLDHVFARTDSTRHNSDDRRTDRALALYLQRVCSKNDTFSRFGPHGWGQFVDGDGVVVASTDEVIRRRVEIERWVVRALIDTINADTELRAEISPRLHPDVRHDGERWLRVDEERELSLSSAERSVLAACDGRTPAHVLGVDTVASLATQGALVWALEPMARDTTPLATLRGDVEPWRPSAARDHWLALLAGLAAVAQRFSDETEAGARRALLDDLFARLEASGVGKRAGGRILYAAKNPINENCLVGGTYTIGRRSADTLIADASPWFDLYRDAAELCARRVFARLREVVEAAPRRGGTLDYAVLARTRGITDDALAEQVATDTFEQIKREMSEVLAGRPDAHVWQLSADDCRFLRRNHGVVPANTLTVPSADLQAGAASPEDAAAGRLEWIVAELHNCAVLMQHTQYWSCPDTGALTTTMARVHEGPFLLREAGAGAPVHVNAEPAMSSMPGAVYAGSGRPKPHWQSVRPADAEVVVLEDRHDIRLRDRRSGADLGSLVRTVRMLNGIHPFFPFERAPHAPRLKIGSVVVQRESWYVESHELGERSGVSPAFVTALERVRADRGIPRWVFVRPPAGVVATAGWGRDKDNKPLYIDLESIVFLDILERRLRKYGTLVFTEMLPIPSQLFGHSPAGKLSFELRTNLVPE